MKVSYNFVSLVAIGNFNPAILSPDFLHKVCGLELGNATPLTPPEMPVVRGFKFSNHEFLIDLERLTIKEIKVTDIHEIEALQVFQAYYGNLPHTPLQAVGLNINCDLIFEEGNDNNLLQKKITEPNTYVEFFGISEIEITERSLYGKDGKLFIASDLRIENVNSLTRIINIKRKEQDSFSINYNYEAGNLSQDISRLNLLFDQYPAFCDEFLSFVKHLEG